MSSSIRFDSPPMHVPSFAKAMMRFQVFLLRRNWLGGMGDFVMVITVNGRRTGKSYSTPIGYLREGETILAINPGGSSNWFRNLLIHPSVVLDICGQKLPARAEHVTDPAECARIFELYRQQRRGFDRLFGVSPDASPEQLNIARDSREFVRFHLTDILPKEKSRD